MNRLFKMKVFTDVRCVICQVQNDVTAVSGNLNPQPTVGWIPNHTKSKTFKSQADPTCMNFITATHNVIQ